MQISSPSYDNGSGSVNITFNLAEVAETSPVTRCFAGLDKFT